MKFAKFIKDLQTIGNTFLRLCLECVFVWSKIYFYNEKYVGGYQFLVEKGVTFPEELVYFKKEEIEAPEIQEEEKNQMENIVDPQQNLNEKINYFKNLQKELLVSLKNANKATKIMPEGIDKNKILFLKIHK